MRGSPLLRFILLVLLLAGVAVGVRRVTSARTVAETAPAERPLRPTSAAAAVPFRLLLSAPASAVEIDTGEPNYLDASSNPVTGSLNLDPANPHLSLIVRWKNPPAPGEHRFARLTLEPPGLETFIHTFDADGDIDDFLELPLTAAP